MSNNQILSSTSLISLLENQSYGVEYQPIISLKTNEIFAYEALARFFNKGGQNIRPDLVYAALHNSPLSLFQVEYHQKKLQLDNAPTTGSLFVNLDQDSFFSSGIRGEKNPFRLLFSEFSSNKKSSQELTVELIENSELNDAIMSLSMIESLASAGISTAIDDVFNPQCMISTSVIQLVNFVKLDKYVVEKKTDHEFLKLVKCLVSYAQVSNKQVILEGVETENDLLFAKSIGVDFVQGFLYKNQFINV